MIIEETAVVTVDGMLSITKTISGTNLPVIDVLGTLQGNGTITAANFLDVGLSSQRVPPSYSPPHHSQPSPVHFRQVVTAVAGSKGASL